jgi:hypothetical protein
VRLSWASAGGGGTTTLAPGQSYNFSDEPGNLVVTPLTSGASYVLRTNGSIDLLSGAGLTHLTLEVHTDEDGGLPDPVGDGHIGPVVLPPGSTLTVGSRGDFGGVSGDATTRAAELDFGNLTGPITVGHVGQLQASGTVRNVRVADGIDALEGYALSNVTFETDAHGPATATNVVVGPGGRQGLAFGNQPARVIQLDGQDEVTGITDPDGTTYRLTYAADGTPATLQKGATTYTFQYPPGAAPGGEARAAAPPSALGWFREKVSAAVDTATTFVADTAQAVGQTIQSAFFHVTAAGRTFVAKATETFQAGIDTATWVLDQAGNQLLAIGGEKDGDGYKYAVAASAYRKQKAEGGEGEYRQGSHNLGALQYRGAGGGLSYFPGPGGPIQFDVGTNERKSATHAEKQLLDGLRLTAGAGARLVELFTERTPCKTYDDPCETYLAENAGQLVDPGKSFNLYVIVPDGAGSAQALVGRYDSATDLNLPLQ